MLRAGIRCGRESRTPDRGQVPRTICSTLPHPPPWRRGSPVRHPGFLARRWTQDTIPPRTPFPSSGRLARPPSWRPRRLTGGLAQDPPYRQGLPGGRCPPSCSDIHRKRRYFEHPERPGNQSVAFMRLSFASFARAAPDFRRARHPQARPQAENGAAQAGDKKKPKILRSWAKSTKGGGWRRQSWHVEGLTLGAFQTHSGFAPRRLRFDIRWVNINHNFCAMQDNFLTLFRISKGVALVHRIINRRKGLTAETAGAFYGDALRG